MSGLDFYSCLIDRHRIRAFEPFRKMSLSGKCMPGIVVLTAHGKGEPIGGQLWLIQGDVGYSHLTACSEAGYALGAVMR